MKRLLKKPLLLVLLAGLAAGGGYFAYQKSTSQSPEQRYKLYTVAKGDLTQTVSANGTLNPVTLVNVGTQVSGTVRKLYVDFNDQVKQGQIMAELDDAIYTAQVRQSDANIASTKASLDLAVASEERMKSLFAQEYVSRQDLDQAVQARRSAQAQLQQMQAANQKDRANLGYSVIRSPVSGVVVDRQVDVGQTVAASFQTPTLFKIAQDLTAMQIYTSFAEADIGNIKVGQPVRFNVDAFPNRAFHGDVKQIRLNPTTQQNVVTYNVVVKVDNPEQILLPGMTAYVNIAVAKRKDVLLVPNAALRYKPTSAQKPAATPPGTDATNAPGASRGPGNGSAGNGGGKGGDRPRKKDSSSGTVYVLRGGELVPVAITLGITDNRNTEVVGGELNPDDQVVTGENLPDTPAGTGTSTMRMRMF
ncbi:MAG TPA: efflux RND transporter periplasmic adaptor subunit [Azospira sp.]|nr:efflux RND transporter periplasmic adaptor subunit [Azospira sp.]